SPSPPSCLSVTRPPPSSTLFPYTTLFRSLARRIRRHLDSRAVILLNLSVNDRGEVSNDESITEVLVEAYAETVTRDRSYEATMRSEEHTSELQSRENLVCRLLLDKKKKPY